jgi:uncharacterized cupin superfamily protein
MCRDRAVGARPPTGFDRLARIVQLDHARDAGVCILEGSPSWYPEYRVRGTICPTLEWGSFEAPMTDIYDPDWAERGDSPLRGRTARIGASAGAERLGATLYEIDPGQNGSPFHFHHANEEMIIVLSGEPTLRTLDGRRTLTPGEVVACPAGKSGAHQLQNQTDEPVRALVISTMHYPETVEMLDSDKILVISHPPGAPGRLCGAFPRSALVDRLAGELDTRG